MGSESGGEPAVTPGPVSGQMLIYRDGALRLQVRLDGATVWLTQLQIADLFQTTKQNISLHIINILDEGEQSREATVKEYLTVQPEGNRQVRRRVEHYNLDMILAVGYRVRSPRGTQEGSAVMFRNVRGISVGWHLHSWRCRRKHRQERLCHKMRH